MASKEAKDAGEFARKLQFALGRSGQETADFVARFPKFAGVRRNTALEYIAGIRAPYGGTVDKVVDFFRPVAPALSALDFSLDYDEFARRFEAAMAAPKATAGVLPLATAVLTSAAINALVGSWRVLRQAGDDDPRIISEALAIARPTGAAGTTTSDAPPSSLPARLWTSADGGRRCYEGVALQIGQQVQILLTHGSDGSDGMRSLTLRPFEKFGAEGGRKLDGSTGDRALVGIMTGDLGDDRARVGLAGVAVVRLWERTDRAEEDLALRSIDADRDVSKDMLLALGAARRG
jgi:hypothetical protein